MEEWYARSFPAQEGERWVWYPPGGGRALVFLALERQGDCPEDTAAFYRSVEEAVRQWTERVLLPGIPAAAWLSDGRNPVVSVRFGWHWEEGRVLWRFSVCERGTGAERSVVGEDFWQDGRLIKRLVPKRKGRQRGTSSKRPRTRLGTAAAPGSKRADVLNN